MKFFIVSLVLVFMSQMALGQEMHVMSRHHLKAETEAYKQQLKEERLKELKELYPIDVPGVVVTNAGKLLGSKIANLKVIKAAAHSSTRKVDFNCDEPNFLDKITLFNLKRKAIGDARSKAIAEVESDLSEACRQIGGTLNVAEIHYKKIIQKTSKSQKTLTSGKNILILKADVKFEATGVCDRIGE